LQWKRKALSTVPDGSGRVAVQIGQLTAFERVPVDPSILKEVPDGYDLHGSVLAADRRRSYYSHVPFVDFAPVVGTGCCADITHRRSHVPVIVALQVIAEPNIADPMFQAERNAGSTVPEIFHVLGEAMSFLVCFPRGTIKAVSLYRHGTYWYRLRRTVSDVTLIRKLLGHRADSGWGMPQRFVSRNQVSHSKRRCRATAFGWKRISPTSGLRTSWFLM
jgi:hypothetical protein